jgi:hypothetical protein
MLIYAAVVGNRTYAFNYIFRINLIILIIQMAIVSKYLKHVKTNTNMKGNNIKNDIIDSINSQSMPLFAKAIIAFNYLLGTTVTLVYFVFYGNNFGK